MPTIAKGNTEIKVACLECIRGHRSSQCAHVNKVLIEVRKPGRPLNMSLSAGSLPSHLQPAYVVSGHSRCQCPTDGIIPESDWKETDPTAYPKGKGSENAFRVGKTGPKIRPPRVSTLRKESLSFSGMSPIDLSSSSGSPSFKTPIANNQKDAPTNSAGKHSCCHNEPTRNVQDSPVCGKNEDSNEESKVNKSDQEPFATYSPQNVTGPGQHTAFAHSACSNDSQPSDIKPNMLGYYANGPSKVEYHIAYNDFTDDDFKTFIDSLPPAKLREKFPWRQEIYPPPRTMHQPDPLDSLRGLHASGVSNHRTIHTIDDNLGSAEDGCCCGDDCSCLGCAVHPANATTMNHVREATEFMQNDPHYSDETALDFEHIAAVFQARQESKGSSVLTPAHDSTGTSNMVAQAQKPVGFAESAQSNYMTNSDAIFPSYNGPEAGNSGMLNFSESSAHNNIQTGGTYTGHQDVTLPPIVGLVHDPMASSAGGILPHLRGTSQEPFALMANEFAPYDPNDAFLFSGHGDDQHAYALHPISGNDQVFVMSQNRPACVDDHGYCQCGPGCTCDGCQVHKGSQPVGINGHYSTSGSAQSSISEAGRRGGNDAFDTPGGPNSDQVELDWTRLGQLADYDLTHESGFNNGPADFTPEIP